MTAPRWDEPNTKPLPVPVESEAFVLTPEERARIRAIAEPLTLPAGLPAAERGPRAIGSRDHA